MNLGEALATAGVAVAVAEISGEDGADAGVSPRADRASQKLRLTWGLVPDGLKTGPERIPTRQRFHLGLAMSAERWMELARLNATGLGSTESLTGTRRWPIALVAPFRVTDLSLTVRLFESFFAHRDSARQLVVAAKPHAAESRDRRDRDRDGQRHGVAGRRGPHRR